MTGWGNEWPVKINKEPSDWPLTQQKSTTVQYIDSDAVVLNKLKVYNNIMPTHDPYTNPNAIIYYECLCGAILDPGTKSFASLNNHASEKGWKIRFSDKGYIPYCVKCGEKVE